MKSTVNISLFIFILLLVCAFNVEGQKSKWRGKVEYKDEVKVVENPREPVFGEVVYDIFSKEGHYLYWSCFAEDPVVIKNGFFYTVVRDSETDEQYVRIYQINNWDQIKKGRKEFSSPISLFILISILIVSITQAVITVYLLVI